MNRRIDQEAKDHLNEILKIALRKDNEKINIYQTVAVRGMKSANKLEVFEGKEIIEDLSPFQLYVKKAQEKELLEKKVKVESKKNNFFNNYILEELSRSKKLNLSNNQFNNLINKKGFLNNMQKLLYNKINKEFELSDKERLFIKNFNENSFEYDIFKTYLQSKINLNGGMIHMLTKGIQNIEKKTSPSPLISKELITYTGMIQIGLALNELTKLTKYDDFIGLSQEKKHKLKSKALLSKGMPNFIVYCKTLAKEWEFKNEQSLIKINNKIEEAKIKRKNSLKPN